MSIFDDESFSINFGVFEDRQVCDELLDGILHRAHLAWHQCSQVLPYILGGLDEQYDEDTGRSYPFLLWAVDQARGFKLFPDHARCCYFDERGTEFHEVEYGPQIPYDDDFIGQLIHQLQHAIEAAYRDGTITCPECGVAIPVPSKVPA